jgi:uncharacterized protein
MAGTAAADTSAFGPAIAEAYATKGAAVELGTGMLAGALVPEAGVRLPLATMNRHGLIAGATGTGKTRTLQVIAEQLSAAGVATRRTCCSRVQPRHSSSPRSRPSASSARRA